MKFLKTRFDDGEQRLLYAHVTGTNVRTLKPNRQVSFWRFFHQDGEEDPAGVGPEYPSREQIVADTERFGTEFGFA